MTMLSYFYLNSSVIYLRDIYSSPNIEFLRIFPKLPVIFDKDSIFYIRRLISTSKIPFYAILVILLLCKSDVRQYKVMINA